MRDVPENIRDKLKMFEHCSDGWGEKSRTMMFYLLKTIARSLQETLRMDFLCWSITKKTREWTNTSKMISLSPSFFCLEKWFGKLTLHYVEIKLLILFHIISLIPASTSAAEICTVKLYKNFRVCKKRPRKVLNTFWLCCHFKFSQQSCTASWRTMSLT